MGLNAQTTVPTFSANQVLTAEQQNQSARTGVPVFATTVERDAAFGGSGEKTLAEGQLCYLESTNVVQYYDGAAWATVGPQTITSGLNYITGAAFTTATSVSFPNNTFTSTYRNYKVFYQITAVTSDATFSLRFRAAGSDDANAQYDYAFRKTGSIGTGVNVTGIVQTSFAIGESDSTAVRVAMVFDVVAPQIATPSYILGTSSYLDTGNTEWFTQVGGGVFRTTTAFDSLTLISSVASSITGVYRVYGYADA